jgi:hypothetical protein
VKKIFLIVLVVDDCTFSALQLGICKAKKIVVIRAVEDCQFNVLFFKSSFLSSLLDWAVAYGPNLS